MKKMLIENIKPILIGIIALIGVLVGSLSGGYVASVPAPATLGAISGPEITSPFLVLNGVEHRYFSSKLNQASTTICSFRTPAATSTLVSGSAKITTGTTTAIALEMGKATVMDATTTRLVYRTLSSNDQITLNALVASSTTASGDGNFYSSNPADLIFAPNNYINVKYGNTLGSSNVLVGSCKAEFIVN